MIFLLGAFSAGLLALMLLPAFWRRAMRLSRRRMEMLMPLSMDEVIAERDLLRAEFAAEQRRLEQKMEAQAAVQAREMAELGRRATRIVALESDLATLRGRHAELDARHAATVRELAEAVGERGALVKEIYDAIGLQDAMRARHQALTEAHADLSGVAEERRVAIAGLEMKAAGLEMRVEGLEHDVETYARKARNEEDRARGLGEDRDMLLKEIRSIEQMMVSTQARFDAERARSASLQDALDTLRRESDAALLAQREAQKARDAAERARELAEENRLDVSRRLVAQAAAAHAAESAAADRIQTLRGEIAALQGALEAAREARGAAGRAAATQDAALLREAIADIGAKVAQLAHKQTQPGA